MEIASTLGEEDAEGFGIRMIALILLALLGILWWCVTGDD
jgi:hypothetical protein